MRMTWITWTGACCVVAVLFSLFSAVMAIDCYKCTSMNGDNSLCEDKFHTNSTTYHLIARDCQYGFFKGTYCIKLNGVRADGTRFLVRHCSNSNWGKTCGDIRWVLENDEEERITGCLTSCPYDGCNAAPPAAARASHCVLLVALLAAVFWPRRFLP